MLLADNVPDSNHSTPKKAKKTKNSNPMLAMMEALVREFSNINQQFRLSNAIELQRPHQGNSTPDVQSDPLPNLTEIRNIVSPQLACHDEAIQILGAKDVNHFSPGDVALLCDLFQEERQAATYISMSKSLSDEVCHSWLSRKIWGAPDPIQAMTNQLGLVEQYGSPYTTNTSTPSTGSALFDSDPFTSTQ